MLAVPVGPERGKGASKFYLFLWEMGNDFAFFLCCLNPHRKLLKDHYFVFLFIDKTNRRFYNIVLSAGAALCQYFSCFRLDQVCPHVSFAGQTQEKLRIEKGLAKDRTERKYNFTEDFKFIDLHGMFSSVLGIARLCRLYTGYVGI